MSKTLQRTIQKGGRDKLRLFRTLDVHFLGCAFLQQRCDGPLQLPRRPLQDVKTLGDPLTVRCDDVVEIALRQHPPRLAALDPTRLLGNLGEPTLEQLVGEGIVLCAGPSHTAGEYLESYLQLYRRAVKLALGAIRTRG